MPEQFWSLTYREFCVKFAGFIRAENRAQWLIGLHAMLTTTYKKKPRSPDALLGYGGQMQRYPVKTWLKKQS